MNFEFPGNHLDAISKRLNDSDGFDHQESYNEPEQTPTLPPWSAQIGCRKPNMSPKRLPGGPQEDPREAHRKPPGGPQETPGAAKRPKKLKKLIC